MPTTTRTDGSADWNPRYANWARVNGREPAEQLEADRVRWPGGSMCGFTLWNDARHAEFARIRPDAYMTGGSGRPAIVDHASYDAWLDAAPVGHGLEPAAIAA